MRFFDPKAQILPCNEGLGKPWTLSRGPLLQAAPGQKAAGADWFSWNKSIQGRVSECSDWIHLRRREFKALYRITSFPKT